MSPVSEAAVGGVPRRGHEPDGVRVLAGKLAELEKLVAKLAKSANLRNASITGGDGLTVKDADGNVRLLISTTEAAIIAYDENGQEVARYGLLANSDPGEYGIEALTPSGWSHVGSGLLDWNNLDGKPSSFTPSAHTHPGADVTSAVASAVSASAAALADGSEYGFNNTVAGSQFYALWVGNDGGFHFGRNTSSLRFKMNVRDFARPGDLESLRLVTYDRKPTLRPPAMVDGVQAEGPEVLIPGVRGEFGMIAEEVYKVWPEVVTWFTEDGRSVIDGIRYDLIGPRLIPYVQDLMADNRALRAEQAAQAILIGDLTKRLDALEGA